VHQRQRDVQPPLRSTRVGARQPITEVGEPELVEQIVDPILELASVEAMDPSTSQGPPRD